MNNACKKGYKLINEIFKIKEEFFRKIYIYNKGSIYISQNAIILRLLSIFYKSILNDEISTIKYENQIFELLRKEEQIYDSKNYISNFTILKGKSITLTVSLIKETKGKIMKIFSENQPEFFGYTKEQFKLIDSIDYLIPRKFRKIHNEYIDAFVEGGEINYIKKSR